MVHGLYSDTISSLNNINVITFLDEIKYSNNKSNNPFSSRTHIKGLKHILDFWSLNYTVNVYDYHQHNTSKINYSF